MVKRREPPPTATVAWGLRVPKAANIVKTTPARNKTIPAFPMKEHYRKITRSNGLRMTLSVAVIILAFLLGFTGYVLLRLLRQLGLARQRAAHSQLTCPQCAALLQVSALPPEPSRPQSPTLKT